MAESEDALAFNHPEEGKGTASKSKGKKKASPAYKRPYSRVGLATKFDMCVPRLSRRDSASRTHARAELS